MFEHTDSVDGTTVAGWVRRLGRPDRRLDDSERVDLIRALEELKCAAEAAQAVVTADFDASQRAEQAAAGVPAERRGRGIAAQVALARRESPHRGQQHLSLAVILRDELPCTARVFRSGGITEWKATLVARETACLSLADRLTVDEELAGNPDRIETMGDAELVAEARRITYRLDPHSIVARRSRVEAERRVTLRPAPDVMSQLSALLPVKAGVAVYVVLTGEADRLRAAGDPRTRGQIMADTLVDRITGAGTETGSAPRVLVNLVVSDQVLYGTSQEAAHLQGYGPVPADLARELAGSDQAWLRRLYTAPATGTLVAMDTRARLIPKKLSELIRIRDQRCRTPWCDAPIRHGDHAHDAADGGPTNEPNSQGLCKACNHHKQAPGWQARPSPGIRHTITTTTPTGHTYRSTAPPLIPPRYVETHPGVWQLIA